MRHCVWCDGEADFGKDMMYIHKKCYFELTDVASEIEGIKEFIEGKRPNKNLPDDTIEKFLERMEDFRVKWSNSMKLIKEITEQKSNLKE